MVFSNALLVKTNHMYKTNLPTEEQDGSGLFQDLLDKQVRVAAPIICGCPP